MSQLSNLLMLLHGEIRYKHTHLEDRGGASIHTTMTGKRPKEIFFPKRQIDV